jgi:prepilin-type N-terminal cleavage/methylation domain-containing protein
MESAKVQSGKQIIGGSQRGFTLIEALLATIVMLIGLVAVAQLVPVSLSINSVNRASSTALVVEQRILEQMLDQPLTAAACSAPACPDAGAASWSLGSSAAAGSVVGSAVTNVNNSPAIDFSAGQVAGYSFNYIDPNDPYGATYDVRWAVVTYVQGSRVTGKRFLLGARQVGGNGFALPLTLDTTVEK